MKIKEFRDTYTVKKQKPPADIQAQTADFLANGGVIKKIPMGITGDKRMLIYKENLAASAKRGSTGGNQTRQVQSQAKSDKISL